MEKIMELGQQGTVKNYCEEFKSLFSEVNNFEEISEFYAIYLFICGLEPEIRKIFVRWHQYSCNKVEDVISLAFKIDSNGLQDSFSPFDPKSSFYNKDLEFDINITLKELMKDNEWFRNGEIQGTCDNIVLETVLDEVIDNDVLEQNGYDNKAAFKVFNEMSSRFEIEIQETIDDRKLERKNESMDYVQDVVDGQNDDLINKFENEIQETVDNGVLEIHNESMVDVKDSLHEKNDDVSELGKEIKENINEMSMNIIGEDSSYDLRKCLKGNGKNYKDCQEIVEDTVSLMGDGESFKTDLSNKLMALVTMYPIIAKHPGVSDLNGVGSDAEAYGSICEHSKTKDLMMDCSVPTTKARVSNLPPYTFKKNSIKEKPPEVKKLLKVDGNIKINLRCENLSSMNWIRQKLTVHWNGYAVWMVPWLNVSANVIRLCDTRISKEFMWLTGTDLENNKLNLRLNHQAKFSSSKLNTVYKGRLTSWTMIASDIFAENRSYTGNDFPKLFEMEIRDQLYCSRNKGTRRITLRTELTPSMGRLVLQISRKWFAIVQCWYYEIMTRRHYGENYQGNMDIIGIIDVAGEVELISSIVIFFKQIGITAEDVGFNIYSIKILEELTLYPIAEPSIAKACIFINKMVKIHITKIKKELKLVKISASAFEDLLQVLFMKYVMEFEEKIGGAWEKVKYIKTKPQLLHYLSQVDFIWGHGSSSSGEKHFGFDTFD